MPSRPFDLTLLLNARTRRCLLPLRLSSEERRRAGTKNELWMVLEMATAGLGRYTSARHRSKSYGLAEIGPINTLMKE